MKVKTRIISAFPASGKTYLFKNGFEDAVILDSDSSKFSWKLDENGEPTKTRNPEFPENYIKHIKNNIGMADYIMVSSHIDIRKALDAAGLCWIYVAPHRSLMLEWVGRCYIRGSEKGFIDLIINNWDDWVYPNYDLSPCGMTILGSGEYLEDKMPFIQTLNYN